ncbi:hypothetical protein ANRL4_00486 [Anaerolineae bacterium]|nr:hypothetical protein ANRL4_00486 [Anaerolineae bacterium]
MLTVSSPRRVPNVARRRFAIARGVGACKCAVDVPAVVADYYYSVHKKGKANESHAYKHSRMCNAFQAFFKTFGDSKAHNRTGQPKIPSDHLKHRFF